LESIDFKLIDTILTYCRNKTLTRLEEKIDSSQDSILSISKLFLMAADNNYKAIRLLVVKNYKFSAAANVICRSSMDLVFTLCLMYSNQQKYVELYDKSGWREKFEHLQRDKESEFMQMNGVQWLDEFELFLTNLKDQIGITEEESSDLRKHLSYFPTAPQIMSRRRGFEYYKDLSENTTKMLECLINEFYHSLSQISHVTSTGLARHVAPLIQDFSQEKQEVIKSQPVFTAIMCKLILMSEICLLFETNINQKLKEAWTYLALTIPIHDDVYKSKYKLEL